MQLRRNQNSVKKGLMLMRLFILIITCTMFFSPVVNANSKNELENNLFAQYDRIFSKACGPVNTYWALRILGSNISAYDVFQSFTISEEGVTTFEDISKVVSKFGFHAACVRTNVNFLKKLNCIALLHMKTGEESHFVIFDGYQNGAFMLLDGTKSVKQKQIEFLTVSEIEKLWTGNILIISPQPIPFCDNATNYIMYVIMGILLGSLLAVYMFCRNLRKGNLNHE
jgi:hypothetical protein